MKNKVLNNISTYAPLCKILGEKDADILFIYIIELTIPIVIRSTIIINAMFFVRFIFPPIS